MDQQQLIDRLEARAAEVPVGPPPMDLMRTRARRHRQGRAAVLAAAAAVAAIVIGLAWPGSWTEDAGSDAPIASAADPDTPPDGYRYVGVGPVVAAVPQDWGTNDTECGTPMADTVVIDQGVICLALVPRPADVDSLTIQSSLGVGDTSGWTDVAVAGEPALRSPVTRQDGVARQTVLVPSVETLFVAESSSADGATVVGSLLDGLTVLREHTTVPGFQDLGYDLDLAPMVDSYVDRLAELGLSAEVVSGKGRGLDGGTVLETDPAVGSVVAPGDVVRVVAAR